MFGQQCSKGHWITPDNVRGGKRLAAGKFDCLTCHREGQLRRMRAAGVKPQRKPGEEWSCSHDPATSMRATTTGCRICHRERERARYRSDPARGKAAARAWVARNRERHRVYFRAWAAANRRGARLTGEAGREAVAYIALIAGDPCVYCGAPCEHIDHIVPVARGGVGTWDNLAPTCAGCNRAKWTASVLEFLLARQGDAATVTL